MDPLIAQGVALITGAGSGMGQAIATKFVDRGSQKLFLVDLSLEGLQNTQKLVHAINPSATMILHQADITISNAVEGMIKTCVDKFGRLDFAINNAGFAVGGIKTAEMDTTLFDKICNVNEKGVGVLRYQTFLCLKYEIAQMLKQEALDTQQENFDAIRNVRGSIINTASLCASAILKDFPAYASSKHGVAMITKQLAREYAPSKIRINAISPSAVMTPMIAASGLTKEFMEGLIRQAPMNRCTLAEEVAEAVVFLSSSCASAITGVNLPIDGGATLYHLES